MMDRRRLQALMALVSLGAAGCGLATEGLDYRSASGAGGASAASASSASSGGTETTVTTSATGAGGGGGSVASDQCTAGFECVPTIADGTYARTAESAPETCPMGWTDAGKVSDGTDPGCTDCGCNAPVGGGCVLGNVHRWGSKTCAMYELAFSTISGACTDVVSGASGYVLDAPKVAQGSCTPTANAKQPVTEQSLCTFDPKDAPACDGGSGVCVPAASGSFGDVCVLLPSGSSCATGWDQKNFVYGGFMDTRVCSCACGEAGGGACTSSLMAMYDQNFCAGNAISIAAGSGCKDVSGVTVTSINASAGAWTPGSCAASVNKTGQVVYTDAKILCCRM